MKAEEIISIAEKNNIDIIYDYVQDNHFGLIHLFDVDRLDTINCSVKEGSKSKLETILNEKADSILNLFPGFKCILIQFSDRIRVDGGFDEAYEAYYFEFIKKD